MSKEYLNQFLEQSTQKTLDILKVFDRLPNNPDLAILEFNIRRQLESSGCLNLAVITCPSYNPSALLTPNPENYISTKFNESDLFAPRVPKIQSLLNQLNQRGLKTKLTVFIGDTDPQAYVLPILQAKTSLQIDPALFNARQKQYAVSYSERVQYLFQDLAETIPLSELGDLNSPPSQISDLERAQETKFFTWLFSSIGPYKNLFSLDPLDINQMVEKKFNLYGKQGWLINELTGGIVLQTETPWLLRTKMLQSSGAPLAAIYPWIRSEELSVL